MTCRSERVGRWSYRACPDDPPVAADRLRAVVQWVAIDEITGSGPDVDYTIVTDAPGLSPRVAQGGIMGLVGNPARLYPGLDQNTVDIAWSVTAPGYLAHNRTVQLGPIDGFPHQFAPAEGGVIWLHRQPFVLRGRVVQLGGLEPKPLPGVPVSITGVWWTFPPANEEFDKAVESPNLVSLHPGLYAERAHGVDELRRRDLLAVVGQDKWLTAPAVIGDVTVRISDRVGVSAGSVLAFETARGDRVEYLRVMSAAGASTDDQPATVTLAHPLQLAHEAGTSVQVVTPQASSASNKLDRDGVRSDRVAFLADWAEVTDGVVEIGSGDTVEYQTASLYATTSDDDGYYQLPPLSRVACVQLQTPALTLVTSPDYGRYENLVDVVHP